METDVQPATIESKILTIRNQQVMLDRDLAELYGVETRALNQAVKRNSERFPEEFCFQLNDEEFADLQSRSEATTPNLISQSVTSSWGGTRKAPYAFTEQGCAMLSAVLRSERAVQASIQIMRAFVAMRHFLQNNAAIFAELKSLRQHQIETDIHLEKTDRRIDELFTLMDKYKIDETQGIFFQGQIFDAYAKFESFIRSAKKEIILIDNYVDLSVLERLAKKRKGVSITVYTAPKAKLTEQDVQQFNAQYPTLTVSRTTKTHDRFLIIDAKTLYHIGASLKDLGKKCFAFEILDPALIPAIQENL